MTVKDYLLKYKEAFNKTFNQSLKQYLTVLVVFGIPDFDIIKFDKYLHTLGYTEEKHGSMNDYVKQNYGTEVVQLINELLKAGTYNKEE